MGLGKAFVVEREFSENLKEDSAMTKNDLFKAAMEFL
jgi:hypothetical protein